MNWLRKHDKALPTPQVVYSAVSGFGGCYYSPFKGEECIDGLFYPRDNGIILVSTLWPDNIHSTLAHEWRHHWQRFNKGRLPKWPWNTPSTSEEYIQAIKHYFTAWHEWDALHFQHKHAPAETSHLFIDILYSKI